MRIWISPEELLLDPCSLDSAQCPPILHTLQLRHTGTRSAYHWLAIWWNSPINIALFPEHQSLVPLLLLVLLVPIFSLVHVPMSAVSCCRCWGRQEWCQHWSYYEILYILWMKVWEIVIRTFVFVVQRSFFLYTIYQQLAEYFICNFVFQAESPVSVLYAYLVQAGAGRVQLPGK